VSRSRPGLVLGLAAGLALVAAGAWSAASAADAAKASGRTSQADGEPATRPYRIDYEADVLPAQGLAEVQVRVRQDAALLKELRLSIDPERHLRFSGDGEVETPEPDRVLWRPPPDGGTLRYQVALDHLRDPAEYDARCTRRWALFRGEDLFPGSSSRFAEGARPRVRLRLRVPPDWELLTPYERSGDGSFHVEQPDRVVDRPTGWILAGDLDVVRAEVAGMDITLASPDEHRVRHRDIVAFLRFTLPHLREILGTLPGSLLIVGADDPMWRGGLSGPGSLYLHADRPLVEHDGTSPLLHELVHVATHAASGAHADWIVEGLAEYYGLEVLRRAGAISDEEHGRVLERLARRASKAGSLGAQDADSATTAKAVLVLRDLDRTIRAATGGDRGLDDVVRILAAEEGGALGRDRFQALAEEVAGSDLDAFFAGRLAAAS